MSEETKQERTGEISLDELAGDFEMQLETPAKPKQETGKEEPPASKPDRIQAMAATVGDKAGSAVKAAGEFARKQAEAAGASVMEAVKTHGPVVMDQAKKMAVEGVTTGAAAAKTGLRSFVKAAFYGFAGIGIVLVALLLLGRSTPDEPKPWYSFSKDPQPSVGRYIDKGTERVGLPKVELKFDKK